MCAHECFVTYTHNAQMCMCIYDHTHACSAMCACDHTCTQLCYASVIVCFVAIHGCAHVHTCTHNYALHAHVLSCMSHVHSKVNACAQVSLY